MIGNKNTILVTGGAGFIGSNLCEYLVDQGNEVICVDSFFSGKKDNIKHLLNNKNFTLIKHNIIYPLKNKFKRIDEIYNLACPASPVQYQFDPVLTMKTSLIGTMNMLDLARKYNAKMIQASTSEVYGDPLEHPQKEDYFGNVDPIGKRACYDEGKRSAEAMCKDYNLQYKVDVRIIRLFNIYGPRMMFNDGRVVSNFIIQSLLNEDVTVHGDGSQSRSFMYISDLIKAFVKLMQKKDVGIGPFNIGNPDERTIKSLAEDIINISKSNSKIIYLDYEKVPERLGDPKQRCPNISRIQSLIEWKPEIRFFEGLNLTIQDFKNRFNNKTKVLIFIPSFLPFEGPAEKAVKEITNQLIGYKFDVITTKQNKELARIEKIGRTNIYRVGFGNRFDKYLLPIIGAMKAISLQKKNDYQVAWGIMASYGSLAALIFSFISKISVLISLYEGKIELKESKRKRLFLPLYKTIFRKADHLQLVVDLTQTQSAWLEDDKKIHSVDIDNGWDYVAKKTKEEFQELEILSSRL